MKASARAALLLSLFTLAPVATAQRIAWRMNDDQVFGGSAFADRAVKLFAPHAVTITAVEFALWTPIPATPLVTVRSVDPTTGEPGGVLGGGSVTMPVGVAGFFGARITPPIALQPQSYVYIEVVAAAVLIRPGGEPVEFRWWRPQYQFWDDAVEPVKYRVYTDTHAGNFAAFGTGKPGTNGRVPWLTGSGFPNTGNPIGLQVTDTIGAAPVVLLFGTPADVPIPFGTLYVAPIVAAITDVTSGGVLGLEIAIPLDDSLAGVQVGVQAWILDPGAADGLAHTAGLRATLGR